MLLNPPPADKQIVVEAVGLSVSAGRVAKKLILDHIDVTVSSRGLTLVGENGSGKTTLLRALATAVPIRSGTVHWGGKLLAGKTKTEYRQHIGYVPQDINFVPYMTVTEILQYAGWVTGLSKAVVRQKIPTLLEEFNLVDKESTMVRSLSGGQRRRLGIAAGLIHDPDILFLDEPTAGLDPENHQMVIHQLRARAESTILCLVSHIDADIQAFGDDVAVLRNGQLVARGSWEAIAQPEEDLHSVLSRIYGHGGGDNNE